MSNTYMLKSDIAHKRGQKEISYKYLLEGNRNAEELNDERHSFLSKLDMANWHIKYDDFQSATHYISLIDTTLLANPELRRKYLSTLSTISEGKELYKDALIQYKAQYEIQDSLEKAGLSDQLAQLLEQYKNIEREKEIVNLKAENLESKLKFRSYLFGFGILCSALLMLSLWLFYFNRQKYLQQNSKRIEIEQRLLRSQMNPHFIFNSLNSIQGFFVNNGVKEGSEYLGKFSNLMRRILNQTSLEHHPLQTEIETLDIYLSIEKSRMEGKMTYNIDVSPEIETEFIQIPPLLLQPIVENAIWHGIAPKDGNGHIEIIIREDQKESQLIINIEDNGVGLNHSSNNHKPRGMKITQDRLGKNGKFKIVNNDKNQGVTVEIKINLND